MALTRINNQALTNVTSAGLPSGTVLQMKKVSSTTGLTTSGTNNDWSDLPSMSVSITPTTTNSKMLITYVTHIYVQNTSTSTWTAAGVRLLRGSTVIQTDKESAFNTGHFHESNEDRFMLYATKNYIDEPNTTSAVTYHLEGATTTGGRVHILNAGAYGDGGYMIIMEIAG